MPSLTAEVFSVPLAQGAFLVYAPLRRAAFVASAATVNLLADLGQGHFDAEADADGHMLDLLRRLELVDSARPEQAPITVFEGDPQPTTVSLFLTTACNLRCSYCYAAAGDAPARFMEPAVAERGIDFVASNAARRGLPRFEVAFHGGGEPAVNWRTLTRAAAYAQARAADLGLTGDLGAATNGVLSDAQIDWITDNLRGVSVSFDGLPDLHDRQRPMKGGGPSSDRVMHTLRRFDEAGLAYGIRMTVTRELIETLPSAVHFLCTTFRPQSIQVEPAYRLGRGRDAPSAEIEAFIEAYRLARQVARDLNRRVSFSAARLDTLTSHFCGISQDNFCLTPDGNVSACYEVFSEDSAWSSVFVYGRPDPCHGGFAFDAARLAALREQAVQHRPHCQGCFAKWHCAGDCHHKALATGGPAEFAGSGRCHITRELTKDLILDRIEDSGGLFWHEQQDLELEACP